MSRAGELLWQRRGLVLGVPDAHGWWRSHAQVPNVLPIHDRLWRIYVNARDASNRSHIIALDVDPGDDMRTVALHDRALLQLGAVGQFDHEGMAVSCAVRVGDEVRLYYTGVALRRDVPTHTAIGAATSTDGLHFRKAFDGPVLTHGPHDPLFVLSGHVLPRPGGFRAWYVSGTRWVAAGDGFDMLYAIRAASSVDGLFWHPATSMAVPACEGEALGRPFALDTGAGTHLWYCRRGIDFRRPGPEAYRLYSLPLDAAGHAAGPPEPVRFSNPAQHGDFDSWMQCYPCVVPYGDDLVMFYNGDHFGRAGFGWARCEGGASACL